MSTLRSRQIITTGLAMFSMFFGAGNIVFPLMVGQMAGNMVGWALVGLMIAAVGIPFMGLISMIYYEGNYKAFFARIGETPGYLVTLFIMIAIGPVIAIPRCISLSYGTIHLYFPAVDQFWFSVGACLVIFAATFRKSRVVDLLGEILAPLLVLCLSVIIIKGLFVHPAAPEVIANAKDMFMSGLFEGYNTMDLLGTFFFSSITIASLKHHFPKERDPKVMASLALKASIIGAGLLGGVYVGFALIASYYGELLAGLAPEILLGTMAHVLLGNAGGFFVSMAVALACLTTAVTLAAVFAEFIQRQSGFYHLGYTYCLVLTLIGACAFANLGFSGIVGLMAPVLIVGYPAILMLVVFNALHKTHGIRMVKEPVALTALASFVHYNWAWFAPLLGA